MPGQAGRVWRAQALTPHLRNAEQANPMTQTRQSSRAACSACNSVRANFMPACSTTPRSRTATSRLSCPAGTSSLLPGVRCTLMRARHLHKCCQTYPQLGDGLPRGFQSQDRQALATHGCSGRGETNTLTWSRIQKPALLAFCPCLCRKSLCSNADCATAVQQQSIQSLYRRLHTPCTDVCTQSDSDNSGTQ